MKTIIHFLILFIALLFAPSTAQTPSKASVINTCSFPVYLLSQPNDGSPAAPTTTLAAHGGSYSETQRPGGSAIKVGTAPTLLHPLTQGYTPSDGLLYYDLSDQAGNPFLAYKNTLVTTSAACAAYSCAPDNETCYSDQNHLRIYACKAPVSLTLTLCAA